ncbi:MAG: DUF4019 domain-containing protein [Acidobacteria bacterium]|nr:DUF4019 domain-containing protein [Acidobacteriota bacterium]
MKKPMQPFRSSALFLAMFALTQLAALAQAKDSRLEAAQRADETWLALVDSSKYAEGWKSASAPFQAAVSQDKWVEAMTAARTPLGKLVSRKLVSATYSNALPGAPEGEYEVLIYETIFEHKPLAHETIIAMLEKDAAWRVAGYYIK